MPVSSLSNLFQSGAEAQISEVGHDVLKWENIDFSVDKIFPSQNLGDKIHINLTMPFR